MKNRSLYLDEGCGSFFSLFSDFVVLHLFLFAQTQKNQKKKLRNCVKIIKIYTF